MITEMPRKRLPFVQREKSRHHNRPVWYFRRGDGPRVRLPDQYGTDEFIAAYNAALTGAPPKAGAAPTKAKPNTLRWVIDQYRQSAVFRSLASTTKAVRERILVKLVEAAGTVMITDIDRASVIAARDKRIDKPEAANTYVKTIRAILDYALDAGLVERNVARDVKLFSSEGDGFHTWSIDEVALFENRHPVGSKARLALDIMLFTGLRRSDVVVLGKQHVRNGVLTIRTMKTGEIVSLRLLPSLAESIAATETGDLTYLVTEHGQPYTANGFGNWFRRRCAEAGVPGSAHGLRKAAAVRAAENGATTEDLKAMFGWTTSKQPDVYTKAANRAKMGVAASSKLERQEGNIEPRTSAPGAGERAISTTKSVS